MADIKARTVDSPIGRRKVDSTGSPVGVVRMDVDKSYADVGELLKKYLNESDQEAWGRITEAIICRKLSPSARAASYCPRWMALRPPRTVSATKAPW